MKKEEFLKVISEKDNDQNVNELIGEIEEHVFSIHQIRNQIECI